MAAERGVDRLERRELSGPEGVDQGAGVAQPRSLHGDDGIRVPAPMPVGDGLADLAPLRCRPCMWPTS